MNRRFSIPLLLCVVLLSLAIKVLSQKAANVVTAPQFERLKQSELNQLANKLAAHDLREYTLRIYDTAGRPEKEETVRGLFLMRDPAFLKKLPGGGFDDRQGNLVFLGRLFEQGEKGVSYSLTLTAFGDAILAFDLNADGVADEIVGKRLKGKIWELANSLSPIARECFEARLRAGGLIKGISCWGNKDSDKSDSVTEGRRTGSADEWLEGMSEPKCDPVKLPNFVRDIPENAPTETLGEVITLDVNAERARDAADAAYRNGNTKLGDNLHQAAEHAEAAGRAAVESRTAPTAEERARAHETYINERREYFRERGEAREQGDKTIYLPHHGPLPPLNRRPASPAPEDNDPRCGGQTTRVKQGLWFLDRRYCEDRDFISCYMRASDAVQDATQGRCHDEVGPDDSRRLVCEKQAEEDSSDPSGPRQPDAGPTDGPALPIKLGPRQQLRFTFVSTVPLGALLAVRCQVDDCRFAGDMKKLRPDR